MSQLDGSPHYRIDDLRRFLVAVGVASGLSPQRATAFASYLLWFDAAGFRAFGVNGFADWLGRVNAGEFDPASEGKIESEHPGTVVLDAARGLPPLVVTRAAALAVEKARDTGIALVRIKGLGTSGPFTPVAAEMAIGPEIGAIFGPNADLTVAVPSSEGLPLVLDTALTAAGTSTIRMDGPARGAFGLLSAELPWALFAPGEGVHVAALAVKAFEPLATFHDRVGSALRDQTDSNGLILPAAWDARRREAREHGVTVDPPAWARLESIAAKLDVPLPEPELQQAQAQTQ